MRQRAAQTANAAAPGQAERRPEATQFRENGLNKRDAASPGAARQARRAGRFGPVAGLRGYPTPHPFTSLRHLGALGFCSTGYPTPHPFILLRTIVLLFVLQF